MKKLVSVILSNLIIYSLLAQDNHLLRPKTFIAQQFNGLIGNAKITMQLYFLGDSSVTGCYFYDRVGELIPLKGKINGLNISLSIESRYSNTMFYPKVASDESFNGKLFIDSLNNFCDIKGNWRKADRTLSFSVSERKTNIDWRYFSLNYTGYLFQYNNEPLLQNVNFIYPSLRSSACLNNSIMSLMLSNENSSSFKKYIELINIQSSKSFSINSEYDNDEIFSDYNCECWFSNIAGYITYYNDSLLSYSLDDFRYVIGANGQPNNRTVVFKVSTGKEVHLFDILDKDYYNQISTLVSSKYGANYFNDSIVPYRFDSFQVAPGGLYLIESSICDACSASSYFLTYKELEPYINDPYRYLINKKDD